MDMRELWGASQKAPPKRGAMTVSQLNQRVKSLLERQHPQVTVIGELSAPRISGGHCYFKLKDGGAVVAGVMFRGQLSRLGFKVEHGLQVVIEGRVTLYAPSGQYQVVAEKMSLQGQGSLQQAFDALKEKLKNEGLFAQELKRPLPRFPKRVALITSLNGAVLRDIVDVSQRRWPQAQLLAVAAKVQGMECVPSILSAMALVEKYRHEHSIDVLILARGGGSFEDLFPFSDERLVRAIAAFPIPVVSAVGHETDFSLSDFAADLRAPTPSAAAELVFPNRDEVKVTLQQKLAVASSVLQRRLARLRQEQAACTRSLQRFRGRIRDDREELLRRESLLSEYLEQQINGLRLRLDAARQRIDRAHPGRGLAVTRGIHDGLRQRVIDAAKAQVLERRRALELSMSRLHALSPLSVLERGFGVVTQASGLVTSVEQVRSGDEVEIRLADGRLEATVGEIVRDDER